VTLLARPFGPRDAANDTHRDLDTVELGARTTGFGAGSLGDGCASIRRTAAVLPHGEERHHAERAENREGCGAEHGG
jgi:hypothetical protein